MLTKEEVDQMPAVRLVRKASTCLYLELPERIADDVKQKIEDAIAALATARPTAPAATAEAEKWQGAALLALELEGWLSKAHDTTTWTKHSDVLEEGIKSAIATIRQNAA